MVHYLLIASFEDYYSIRYPMDDDVDEVDPALDIGVAEAITKDMEEKNLLVFGHKPNGDIYITVYHYEDKDEEKPYWNLELFYQYLVENTLKGFRSNKYKYACVNEDDTCKTGTVDVTIRKKFDIDDIDIKHIGIFTKESEGNEFT